MYIARVLVLGNTFVLRYTLRVVLQCGQSGSVRVLIQVKVSLGWAKS